MRYDVSKEVSVDQLRSTVNALDIGEPTIQYMRDPATGSKSLQITTQFEQGNKVEVALTSSFPEVGFQRIQLERVGPVVGSEIQKSAILASLLAMFGILVYVAFRYEFSFAVGAGVAVIHDLLMTMGVFFLSGRELSAPIVAAVLTIIGFSINDTIVIFDRIREDLKMGLRGSFKELMNHALNRTLSRTVITSGTVFLSTLSLYIFGGGVINDFAFTFLVGILTGTYSSIYIAGALVLWWHRGHRPKLASQVLVENAATARA
jgi:SecD/SecF fusion protein